MNQKPVDDKELPLQILSSLFVKGLQVGGRAKTAEEVGYPIKEALVKLDAHYQKKYLGLLPKILDREKHARDYNWTPGEIDAYNTAIREALANMEGE